jgi:predicted Zn-dependent peptidase
LFWELIDTGRAETATIWPQLFEDCGCLFGYLCCDPQDVEENAQVMQKVIDELLTHGVTQHELDLARNKISSSLILSDERPSNRLFALGQSWLTRRSYEPLDVVLSRYAAVTCADVIEIARRTLSQPSGSIEIVQGAGQS